MIHVKRMLVGTLVLALMSAALIGIIHIFTPMGFFLSAMCLAIICLAYCVGGLTRTMMGAE